MDLSAIIFVVLALAWAVYLIPKALKHHDEMASDRLVEGHSDKVRILSRKAKNVVADVAEAVTPAAPKPTYDAASDPGYPARKAPMLEADPVPAPVPTRATARKAAQRRRRVLGVLVVALLVVWALTWLAYLPIWAPGVPGALVVAWLVIARLSVRKQQRTSSGSPGVESAPVAERHVEVHVASSNADQFLDQLADEDTSGLARAGDRGGPRRRRFALGPAADDASDVRQQGPRPSYGPHHRAHRHDVLGPRRDRQRARPRGP